MSEKEKKFVHLHLHTEYSLLDGAIRILDVNGKTSEFFSVMKNYGMDSVAITDHGNMYGVIEFYKTCKNNNIKPIIGSEVYVAEKSRLDKSGSNKYFHLTLLAENEEGYRNLMKIVSIGYLEGFYYKPRVDKEILAKYSKGIIALSGCMSSEISKSIINNYDTKNIIKSYLDIYGENNFFLEIQDNNIEEQKKINKTLIDFSKSLNLELVATNDCHYLKKEDAYIQDILLCIGTGKTLKDSDRMRFSTNEFYFKSAQEMYDIFDGVESALENTIKISDRCNLDLNFSKLFLPKFEVPSGYDENSYLTYLCNKNILNKFPEINDVIKSRLAHELDVIIKMGFSAYFLIVYDFIRYAKTHNIPVGPGRGSGAGSIVAYLLDITDVDPIKYDLIFERFLNPSRITMPDLDIDFADTGREKVIDYVREKYGEKNVSQIVTFGSMQSRLAIRDIGRVLDISLKDTDKIAKLIPLGENINNAIKEVEELKNLMDSRPDYRELLEITKKIEGMKRHIGVHAAGILISDSDMSNYVPFTKSSKGVITTQYEGEHLVSLGLLKMDFLGLKNLSIIDDAIKLIKKFRNLDININKVPIDDKKTFDLLKKGNSIAVFQLESRGMQELLKKIAPEDINDIIALIALYRPGPMGSGMLDDFVNRKHGKSIIKYDHPCLEPILKETYGVILYQEQVMRIAMNMGEFSASKADNLRKAMGKKIPEILEKEKASFIEGALKNNISEIISSKVFDNIIKFGGYGFNKSHSTAYGLLSYRTAFLKANYIMEYMTSVLNNAIGDTDAIINYINECKNIGIKILPIDINKSDDKFSIESLEKKEIRLGLSIIKGMGEKASNLIVQTRKENQFSNFYDFLEKMNTNINKKVVENLIKVGAFDNMNYTRSSLLNSYENILENIVKKQKEENKKQISFFDEILKTESKIEENIPNISEFSESILLGYEKEALGFFINNHPMEILEDEIKNFSNTNIKKILDSNSLQEIKIIAFINEIKKLKTKKGETMAIVSLLDITGEIEGAIFPNNYTQYLENIKEEKIVFVKAKVDEKMNKRNLIINEIIEYNKFKELNINKLCIEIKENLLDNIELLQDFKKFLEQEKIKINANKKVIININLDNKLYKIDTNIKIPYTDENEKKIKEFFGKKSLSFSLK